MGPWKYCLDKHGIDLREHIRPIYSESCSLDFDRVPSKESSNSNFHLNRGMVHEQGDGAYS